MQPTMMGIIHTFFELSGNDEKLLSLYSRERERYLKLKEELLMSISEG